MRGDPAQTVPTSDEHLAEVLLSDYCLDPVDQFWLFTLIIKERNEEGKWRYVYMKQISREDYFNYESPYAYDDILGAHECGEITCVENGMLKDIDFPSPKI